MLGKDSYLLVNRYECTKEFSSSVCLPRDFVQINGGIRDLSHSYLKATITGIGITEKYHIQLNNFIFPSYVFHFLTVSQFSDSVILSFVEHTTDS